MPPRIKIQLVKSVLKDQIKHLQFFFKDVNDKVVAPENFVSRLMVSFDSIIYEHEDCIVAKGETLDDLFFIM